MRRLTGSLLATATLCAASAHAPHHLQAQPMDHGTIGAAGDGGHCRDAESAASGSAPEVDAEKALARGRGLTTNYWVSPMMKQQPGVHTGLCCSVLKRNKLLSYCVFSISIRSRFSQ